MWGSEVKCGEYSGAVQLMRGGSVGSVVEMWVEHRGIDVGSVGAVYRKVEEGVDSVWESMGQAGLCCYVVVHNYLTYTYSPSTTPCGGGRYRPEK